MGMPGRVKWAHDRRMLLLGTAAQVALAFGLLALVVTGQWLADPIGLVAVALGAAGLVSTGVFWWWTRIRPPLIAVDIWYAVWGALMVVSSTANPLTVPPDLIGYAALHALGGAQVPIGLEWLVAGAVGAIVVQLSRR